MREGVHAQREQLANSAPGTAKRDLKRDILAFHEWFDTVPGLEVKVNFLAWKYRAQSPIIQVTTESFSDEAIPNVLVLPRTQCDVVTGTRALPESAVTIALAYFSKRDFRADETILVFFRVSSNASGLPYSGMSPQRFAPYIPNIHSSTLMTLSADDFAAEVERRRNNPDATYVRLTGLRGAAHLNGQEAILDGQDPNNPERFIVVLLESGKDISVRSQNYELVWRPKLLVDEF